MYMHARNTVHAAPDLRVAAGRLRDGVSVTLGTSGLEFRRQRLADIACLDGLRDRSLL